MDDRQLVERSQAGDVSAFEELVRRHQGRAYAIAYHLLRNREDAQEVAQEAFARAYLRIREFRAEAQFRTWLYRILVNLATDLFRKRKWEVPEEEGPLPVAAAENPGDELEQKVLRQAIQRAIEALPGDLKTVIILRELEGLSYQEIAQVIRRPIGTVMSRLFHARRKLQEALAPYGQRGRHHD